MEARTGARVIIDALIEAGVDTVFGYPGGANMPLYDELLDSPIDHVLTRHEQGAIHAADGYSRASGKLGVCIATSGPGATNLVTGISTAQMDSSAVLCITGQVPTQLVGTDAFQEADVLGIAAGVTKHAYLVRDENDLPEVMAEAIFVARTGRPGPVLVDVPKNVFVHETTACARPATAITGYHPAPHLDRGTIKQAHDLLKQARRPVCIVGGGCKLAGATDEFRRWCDATGVPVVSTLNGIGCVASDYPGALGFVGMHGLRRANRAVPEADVLVALGVRFDDRVTGKADLFAKDAKIIHIDIDDAEIDKLVAADVAVHADLKVALAYWVEWLAASPVGPFTEWQRRAMSVGTGLQLPNQAGDGRVPAIAALDTLIELVGCDTIVATDVGQHQMWAAQRVRPSHPRKFLTSGGAGTMGFGMPSAMGAQLACTDQRVVAIVGDGGFQMTMPELATIGRLQIPVKIFLMDNKYLGMVRQWQELFFENRYSSVDMSDNPDFAAIAEIYAIPSFKVDSEATMPELIDEWFRCEGPALLHVLCQLEENVFPMIPAGSGLEGMVEAAP